MPGDGASWMGDGAKRGGRGLVETPNRVWLKLLCDPHFIYCMARETKGHIGTRGVRYERENQAICHPWLRGRKFLMSEISRLPLDIPEKRGVCAKVRSIFDSRNVRYRVGYFDRYY